MASSNAAWVFGGVRLISSASTTLPKIGPWTKVHLRWPVVRSSSMMSVPVMSEGIRSGRELDAPERQAERLRNGAHHQRLGGAGQAGDQAMPTDKERGKDLVQHIFLADDYLAHLGEDAITDRIEPFDALLQLGCVLAKFRERDHRQFPSSRLHGF